VSPTGLGHLTVYPDTNGSGTTSPPDTSNINYIPGRDIPNMITVQLPADRTIDFYSVNGGVNTFTNLVVDVIGYIDATPGGGTTTPPPPPPPPFTGPIHTATYTEGSASEFCAEMDAARQAAGSPPFNSCARSAGMVAHALAMAQANNVWDGGVPGDMSNISGERASIAELVAAFMASPPHRNTIVGGPGGLPGAAYVGCYWSDDYYQSTADPASGFHVKTVWCAANFTYYP
jgi:hypothetical protein